MKPSPGLKSLASFKSFSSPVLLLVLPACTGPRPQHGGRAFTSGVVTQTLAQAENPSQPSRISQDTIRTRTYTLPARTNSASLVPSVPSRLIGLIRQLDCSTSKNSYLKIRQS